MNFCISINFRQFRIAYFVLISLAKRLMNTLNMKKLMIALVFVLLFEKVWEKFDFSFRFEFLTSLI